VAESGEPTCGDGGSLHFSPILCAAIGHALLLIKGLPKRTQVNVHNSIIGAHSSRHHTTNSGTGFCSKWCQLQYHVLSSVAGTLPRCTLHRDEH
jgi:hypothetical protein